MLMTTNNMHIIGTHLCVLHVYSGHNVVASTSSMKAWITQIYFYVIFISKTR